MYRSTTNSCLFRVQAVIVAYVVRIAYVVSLLGSLGLNNFPLRDALMDVAYGEGREKRAAQERLFVPVTIGILSLVCFLAISLSSIWVVIGYVGSVSATGSSLDCGSNE